jgi:C4-dicarboxylate-specific signal transduction histidine kinase
VGEIMMAALLRRQNDRASQRQREALAHVARVAALGELTAALAHELNQPLAAIGANAGALRRTISMGRSPDNLGEVLSDIARDAERGGALIQRLRTMLKRRETEKVPLDVKQVILDLQPLLSAEVRGHDARIAYRLEDGEKLPRVAGDAVQLQQVVLNLVRNAAEAMVGIPQAEREIVVSSWVVDPPGIGVAVQDAGLAIDDAMFDAMFVPFLSTKRDGLGMGLAISRSLIEAHGGRLWAERRAGNGLTVQFTLPASP